MIKRLFSTLILLGLLVTTQAHAARDGKQDNVGYYGFEPDITTNYVSKNLQQVGFVRITVELMVDDVKYIEVVEHHSPLLRDAIIDVLLRQLHHSPLLRDAIIDVLLRQPEQKIKSMTGREEIRVLILDRLKELMEKETKRTVIRDVLFTKYLYH